MGPVETELRRRATARGLCIGSFLPQGALLWVPYLLKRVLRDALVQEAPLAVGAGVSLFVDAEGCLRTCGCNRDATPVLRHAVDSYADTNVLDLCPLTLVASMQDRRIVSVVTSGVHCLALSREGEVYTWVDGVPSQISSLSRTGSIATGTNRKSAAVDATGRLFTWGRATYFYDASRPSGLG